MAQDAGDPPKGSSWNSWVHGSTGRRSAPQTTADAPTPLPLAVDEAEPEAEAEVRFESAPMVDAGRGDDGPGDDVDSAVEDEALATDDATASADLDVTLSSPGADADADADASDTDDDHVARLPGLDDGIDGDDFDDGSGDLLPAVPLLPTIAGRVDALGAMLRTIAMRVDSLAATTNAFRSAVTDRIDEYADVVTGLSRQSDQTLDDYRRANERTVAELRRGLAEQDEVLHRAAGRLDELSTDVATLVDLVRLAGSEVRTSGKGSALAPAAGVATLGDEIAGVRQDLGYVRGMIDVVIDTMPGSEDGSGGVELTDAQLDQIAERVAARLSSRKKR